MCGDTFTGIDGLLPKFGFADTCGQCGIAIAGNKFGAATGDIHYLADDITVDTLNKVIEVEVEIFDAG